MNSKTDTGTGESRLFVDLFAESLEIKSHGEFLLWAQGKLQEFLPHDVMIAAWGDFALGIIYYEIISAIPGIRTNLMREKEMAAFLKRLYAHWMSQDRTPSQLLGDHSVIRCRDIVDGSLKTSMQNMKTALIHAIKDVRGGSDSFYVLLSSNTDITPSRRKAFHQLLPYIDATLRQIDHRPNQIFATDPSDDYCSTPELSIENVMKLSDREAEIMGWVCSGKTNVEIGLILNISTFTVKNHLQRIFKKLDVVNRSQAVARIRGQVSSF
jgi:transcriptional regulator EpsA